MTRVEAWLRLALCGVGLVLLAVAVWRHGVQVGAGLVEVVGVAGLFLGWTAGGALRLLLRGRR